jgi:Fe-S-cluster containining protein
MSGFVCRRCGKCCGLTPFERADFKRIQRVAARMRVSFVKRSMEGHTVWFAKSIVKTAKAKGVENMDAEDMACPFLVYSGDGKASCEIYDLRPLMCRKFGVDGGESALLRCPYDDRFARRDGPDSA